MKHRGLVLSTRLLLVLVNILIAAVVFYFFLNFTQSKLHYLIVIFIFYLANHIQVVSNDNYYVHMLEINVMYCHYILSYSVLHQAGVREGLLV